MASSKLKFKNKWRETKKKQEKQKIKINKIFISYWNANNNGVETVKKK